MVFSVPSGLLQGVQTERNVCKKSITKDEAVRYPMHHVTTASSSKTVNVGRAILKLLFFRIILHCFLTVTVVCLAVLPNESHAILFVIKIKEWRSK